MKPTNKCHALSMMILTLLATDCKSSEGIVEISNITSFVPIVTTKGTSGENLHLYGATDNELKAMQFAQINWSNLTADMAKGSNSHYEKTRYSYGTLFRIMKECIANGFPILTP